MSYYANNNGVSTDAGEVEITKERYLDAIERMAGGERLAIIDGAVVFYTWPVQLIDENGFHTGEADVLPEGAPLITDAPSADLVKPKRVNGKWVEGEDPDVIAAALVPKSVSPFQARAALLGAGLLDEVEAVMAAEETPRLTKLAWNTAQEFLRDSPTVLSMGAALGLDSAQLDALFIEAATITA